MEINVNELSGSALDWAVAKAIGAYAAANGSSEIWGCKIWSVPGFENMRWDDWTPSTDWAHGGPLIDKFKMSVMSDEDTCDFVASIGAWRMFKKSHKTRWSRGPSALIALCRAIVSAKLGPVVNVPDELL